MKSLQWKKSLLSLGFVALASAVPCAWAATLTWDANTGTAGAQDGSGTWDITSTNWWTGAANAAFSIVTPDVPTFGAASGVGGTVTLGTNIVSANITFNAPAVGNYTIAGGGFTLLVTNRTVTPNVNATISANIAGFGGSFSLANSAANAPSAVLTLTGNNSFTNFNLGANAATTTAAVRVGSSTGLGAPTGTVGIGGGQGNLTSHRFELTGGITISNNVTAFGRNIAAAGIVNLGSGDTLAGTWTRSSGGADFSIESAVANGLTFSGVAGGGVAMTSASGAPRNYILRGSGGGTISGIINNGTGANSLGLVKVGAGTWTLSGVNTFTNVTIVDQGTLTLDYTSQNNSKLADVGPLILGGGTLNLNGGSHTEVVLATTILNGNSSVTRSSGSSTLRMNAITRNRGGVVDIAAASIADTDTLNVNGILGGGYATVAGADWAMNSTGAGDGPITAYTGYTDIDALGSTIADGAASNVRLNSAAGAGSVSLAAATTTIQTLLQNTTSATTIDTASKTLRFGTNGAVLIPSGKQTVTIGTAVNSGTVTAGGSDNTIGELVLINNSTNNVILNSVVADNGTGAVSLTKAGSGSATVSGTNTFSGVTYVSGGSLNVNDDANLGTAPGGATVGKILINGGTLNATESFTVNANRGISLGPTSRFGNGTIGVGGGNTLTYSGIIANSDTTGNGPGASLAKTGAGTLVLGGANTYTFGTIINAGTISITASGNIGAQPGCYIPDHLVVNGGTLEAAATLTLGSQRGILLGAVGAAGTGTFRVDDSVSLQLDSRIADNWNGTGGLTKTGNGTLILTGGFNDWSGDTTISAGRLQLNNSRALPNGTGKGSLVNNGTLALNGVSYALNAVSGNGTYDNISAAGATLTFGSLNTSDVVSGTIQNSGGGSLTLQKSGNGTLTLSGSSTHNGSTLVTAGTLALTGSATIGSTTNIAISSGAIIDVTGLSGGTLTLNGGQTVSGKGSVSGTIDAGSGAIAPGASAGTLTLSGLNLNGGGTLNYDLANVTTVGSGVNDLTVVTGALSIAGGTTLNLSYLNGIPASSGKYTLIQYGSFSGDANNISVPAGFTITNNTATKTIELLINHVPASLVWRGDGSGDVWDINGTANWIQGGTNQFFFNGDTANFDDTGSNLPPIFISTPVIASAVNMNAAQSYNFTGSALAGATLSKGGGGTLTLENDTLFATGTTISGGTLQIGNAGGTGTIGGGNITNNAALLFNRTGDLGITNSISGSGGVTQLSTGTTTLAASNSYAGATLISSGRLYARNTYAFGATNSGTTVTGGAQIYMDVNIDFIAEPLVLNGSGLNFTGDGALRKGGAGVTTFPGPITLGSDTTITIDGGATLNLSNTNGITSSGAALSLAGGGVGTVSGPINLGGGAGVLTKTGTATWTLGGSNSMSLAIVDAGTVILANNNALGTNLNVVLTSTTGGAGLTGTRLTLSGGISIPANRTLALPSAGAGTVRSTFFGTGAGVTNAWAGSVTLFGDGNTANNIGFGVDANSTFLFTGNITADSTFPGKLLLRGNAAGTGIVLGTLALNASTGQVQTDDGSTWIFTSSANTWVTTIFAGSSTIRLGANNALPTATALTVGNGTGNRLDLAGFNQQVAAMDIGAGNLTITNSSAGSDSTLTYSSAGSISFGGNVTDGPRKLNLTVAAGNLTLTNAATLNLTKSAVSIAGGGAVLELDYVGTNVINGLVLNGANQPSGLYNILNASPYIAGVGNLMVVAGPTGPARLTNSVSGNILSLSWPAGQGWRLQEQTNNVSVGLGTNWFYVTDGSVSSTNIVINPANGCVFFRLSYP